MRETLTYFMWGFQQHFRAGVQMETERVLEEIGLPVKPRALLVGFAASDSAAWPICVEPEYRFFQPAHLDGAVERAREIYENDPNYRTMHSDRRMHVLYHQSLVDRCRADAVVEALNRNAPEPVTYFAGHSTRVGDYEVHPIVGIPTDALEAVPQLVTAERDRFPVTRSLLHGCIGIVLGLATKALVQPDAGDAIYVLGASADEVARRAATNLVTSAVRMTGSIYGNDLYAALTAVSTTRYEGASGYGSVIVAAAEDPDLTLDVELRSPVRVGETRALRKLLEISDRDKLGLLTDGHVIFGLGHVADSYNPADERIFEFHVVGQGQWLMRHGADVLFEAEFGQPKLRRERMDKARFVDTVERVFAPSQADSENLWELAQVAAEQAHGTMLVISAAAADEAARLSAQAILIEPKSLSPELLRQATGIDDAVLFAPDCTCYALSRTAPESSSTTAAAACGRRPTSSAAPRHSRASFQARPRAGVFVDKDTVLAAVSDETTCLLNGLDADQHRGTGPTVPCGRPGHIPTSRSMPALELVDPKTQAYLPAAELHSRLEDAGAMGADSVITYCGGGIAASSVAFALLLAGRDNVSVYDASLEEWATDPSLPLDTG